MTSLMDKPDCVRLSETLQLHGRRPADRPELLFVYGGARPFEMEWLLECRHPQSRIFWITPSEPALTPVLEEAIASGRLAAVSVNGAVESVFYAFFNPRQKLEYVLLDAGRASSAHRSRCESLLMDLREKIRMSVFHTGTLVTKGPLWQSNTLQNLSLILRRPGIGALQGAFADRPAVVVGAGPSLNRALPYLKQAQDRVVIISTGTALAPLRNAGIRPDLVIAVDGSHLIGRQFNCRCDDLYLVASTLVYSGIPRRFKGNFFGLLDVSPIDQWVKSVSGVEGKLYAGGTVTACGMDFAALMGCAPVFTVGLDLSFDAVGPSHADGTMYDGSPLRDAMISVPGNYQPEVKTTRQFACYIELVQRLVASRPETAFINVTDSGARIDGMELADFSVLNDGVGPVFDAYARIGSLHRPPDRSPICTVADELAEISAFLEEVQTGCRESAMAANRLYLMERRPTVLDREEMQYCVDVIQRTDELLDNGKAHCDFLRMSLWPAAYELSGANADRADSSSGIRMRRFYEQIAGAAKWTRQLVQQVCADFGSPAANDECESIRNTTGENDG